MVLTDYLHLSIWPETPIAFVIGYCFRVAALWFKWEEPMHRLLSHLLYGKIVRESFEEKMVKGGWCVLRPRSREIWQGIRYLLCQYQIVLAPGVFCFLLPMLSEILLSSGLHERKPLLVCNQRGRSVA